MALFDLSNLFLLIVEKNGSMFDKVRNKLNNFYWRYLRKYIFGEDI